jgi:hypothetical protein
VVHGLHLSSPAGDLVAPIGHSLAMHRSVDKSPYAVCRTSESWIPVLLWRSILLLLFGSLTVQASYAQNSVARKNRKLLQDAPLDQLSDAVHAQAELILAESSARSSDAELSQSLLDARSGHEGFSCVLAEEGRTQRKKIAMPWNRLLKIDKLREVKRRAAILAQWESLFNQERMQIAKLKGTPHNLMLALLNERTEISYSSSLPSGVQLVGTNTYKLDDDVLDAIRVSSPTLSGKRMTFALTDPVAIDLSWWPTLLQQD